MDEQTDLHRYTEPLLREHGSLRDLTVKSGEKTGDKLTDKVDEKGKEKEGDKNVLKDLEDKPITEKGTF